MVSQPPTSAPAKLNLFLDITGRRTDGYHEILTVFVPLPGLRDTVRLQDREPGSGIAVVCDHPDVPDDESNTVWRAAEAFAKRAGVAPNWEIHIDKEIPVAAGLGGGSSDAAVVLRLLNTRHNGILDRQTLRELAVTIGADVPFFLAPQPAMGRGIGERLTPFRMGFSVPAVVVNPGFPIAAGWAYRNAEWRPGGMRSPAAMLSALGEGDIPAVGKALFNVFEAAVIHKFPLVDMLLDVLREHGSLGASLSGSGPTVFGLCRDGDQAEATAAAVREYVGSGCWVWTGVCGSG